MEDPRQTTVSISVLTTHQHRSGSAYFTFQLFERYRTGTASENTQLGYLRQTFSCEQISPVLRRSGPLKGEMLTQSEQSILGLVVIFYFESISQVFLLGNPLIKTKSMSIAPHKTASSLSSKSTSVSNIAMRYCATC